jgi:hypothetical protein
MTYVMASRLGLPDTGAAFRCWCLCGCTARIPVVPARLIQTDKHMQPLCDACVVSAGPDCTMRRGFFRRILDGFRAWCRP